VLFSKEITIPASTSKTDYYSENIEISKGKVRKVFVLIPVPSAWAVGVSIWYATWQVWPTSRTEWIPGGMVRLEFEENIEVDDVPLSFQVRCYNEDTVNDHKVWVGINVLRPTTSSEMQEFFDLFQG